MNPLTFFPPPSRSLSRVDSRPSSGGNGAQNNGGNSSSNSTKSVRRTMQPLSTTSSRAGSSSKVQTINSINFNGNGHTMESTSSSSNASGATTPERTAGEKPKRPVTSPSSPTVSSEMLSPRLRAVADGYTSDPDASKQGRQSGTNSPRAQRERNSSNQLKRTSTNNSISHAQSTGGRLGHRLPQGLYFDLVRPNEVGHVHRLEVQGYDQDDAASLETLRYRQREAPHLFLGAFLPLPLPKVSGPLSMSGPPPRKLIGYVCGTAASALTARAIRNHTDDEHSWLVCLWTVCVSSEYRKKGLGLKLIEEYIRRLRRAEEGEKKKGYECVATLCHEDTIPLFEKAAFKKLGVSHVNAGSGGWFELRRYISPKDHDEEEEGGGSSGSASDKNEVRSPLSSSGFLNNPATADPDSSDLVDEVSTTPTQELERRLQAHAVSTSNSEGKLTSLIIPHSNAETEAEVVSSPTMLSPSLADSAPLPANAGKDMKLSSSPQESGSSDTPAAAPALSGFSPFGDTSTFSTAKIMEALGKQDAKKNREGPRNPGIAYSTIMGQTLASKTSVEDAFYALEARLVNREDQSNLADLYCPREECSCLLLKGGNADWEIAEMGPLTQANLSLPNSPSPPSAPVPPPPASLDRVRSALGGHQRDSSVTSTAAHAFWIVHSPMIFENIGFSRDSEWRLPPLPSQSISSNGSEGDSSTGGGYGSSNAGSERKKPVKKGSLFRGIRDTIDKSRERRNTNSNMASGNQKLSPNSVSPTNNAGVLSSSSSSSASAMGASYQSSTSEAFIVDKEKETQKKVKVKYLLCADCDCGPLGYTVLPSSLEGGGFAKEVGKQAAGQFENEEEGGDGQPSKQLAEHQLYFVAADRVRYRLPK